MFFKTLAFAAAVGSAAAQRPSNTSICDYYTTALLTNNTAANQMTLLTLVVNTAVIGNYTKPNVGITVPGILAAGEVNGEKVDLLPYFTGGLASTNFGGSSGRAVNFLDGGGAAPLMMNMPANSTTSLQYTLLTHLYEYFGALLGCSMQGGADYPAYSGRASMYNVHKFMDLSSAEVTYFINQVALSAMSFGVAESDLTVVGTALNSLFNVRCAPNMTVIPSQGAVQESICIADDCPLAPNATCSSYAATMEPSAANSTNTFNATTSSTTTPSGTSTSTSTTSPTSGAVKAGLSIAAVFGGVAAFLL